MEVEYKNKQLEKICENRTVAERKYGVRMAELIHHRIDQIRSFESVEMMIAYKIGRCHKLEGNRKDQYAVDLVHPQRLVFEKHGDSIQIAYILEIVDYH